MALSKKKLSLLVGAGVVGIALGGTAVLANGSMGGHHRMSGAHMDRMITEMDSNGDGSVTKAEAQAYRDARFAEADADGDGAITPKEMAAAKKMMRFKHLDKNGDGAISQDEYLTADMGRKHGSKRFWRMDDDGSGRIEAAEMAKITDRMFGRMDRNDDGTISAEELQSMRDHSKH